MVNIFDVADSVQDAIQRKDEVGLVKIAGQYRARDRYKVMRAYQHKYKTDLEDAIRKALKNGRSEDFCAYLWVTIPELRAELIKKALNGKNDDNALIDLVILCNAPHWNDTCVAYTRMYKKVLGDDLLSQLGTKTNWHHVFKHWIKHSRSPRYSVQADADQYLAFLKAKNYEGIAQLLGTTVTEEYREIAKLVEEKLGTTIVSKIESTWNKLDCQVLLSAHYYMLHPARLAGYLLECATEKKGDERRVIRISLTFDICLAAKFALRERGIELQGRLRSAFDERFATLAIALWRA
ncbi:Alpha-6 giardin [Giardia muris]|uniref:Alpha-6 giardin n=1 Tax=Giardia muris TaxID=5742 RepID=A0A142C650_GIAMU|nr:alpha-6 giardin [Giardia muris]TNJ29126.1 Alpha-6 giardin [Giardia muris]|eukprot:TNJ29126.1 Alpha-6 giardin [Giardia muris]